jgi:hypothetical protein
MMKLQNVPLSDIADNPWRDKDLYPLDDEHVQELRESIGDHDFFESLKGRRVNGKVEIACGHARVAAARKARLDTVPVYVADLDDDVMLRLMVDENATQGGNSPGAVLNEVAAVMRRLVEGLLEPVGNGRVAHSISQAFERAKELQRAQNRLRSSNALGAIGEDSICRYLGQGKPEKSHRSLRQIREAISALKQSGRWDKIIDIELLKHPLPMLDMAERTELEKAAPRLLRQPELDERVANTFKTETQFHAFRDAVTTTAAQRAIPVKDQAKLAKQIMSTKLDKSKQVTTSYIHGQVRERVNDFMKEQRQIDKKEREAYLAEQRDAAIDDELHNANRWLRSLIASLLKLEKLAAKYPQHPKIGGFSARLDDLVDSIKQFARKLK